LAVEGLLPALASGLQSGEAVAEMAASIVSLLMLHGTPNLRRRATLAPDLLLRLVAVLGRPKGSDFIMQTVPHIFYNMTLGTDGPELPLRIAAAGALPPPVRLSRSRQPETAKAAAGALDRLCHKGGAADTDAFRVTVGPRYKGRRRRLGTQAAKNQAGRQGACK
jgi:hypothetical protein